MKKKALSNVVATVLIVLLALVAVVIVWSFVKPTLEESGSSLSARQKCINAEVKATGCSTSGGPNFYKLVSVQWAKGDVVGVRVVLGNSDGDFSDSIRVDGLELFTTKTEDTGIVLRGTVTKAFVSPIVVGDDGVEFTCEEVEYPLTCA
ncbi:MAG: archaellin/type IV pilin N-terminal domain-containing protein [archaeon]